MRILFLFALILGSLLPAEAQQNFSCSYGTRGACLRYNDKIVDKDSVCFSEFTCDFKGFVCKAKFDDMVNAQDTLVRRHNELIRRNKELADAAREILDKNTALAVEYDNLQAKLRTLASAYDSQANELRSANDWNAQLSDTLRTLTVTGNQTPSKLRKP